MTAEKRPNFLIILADDLGFSDVGCFGSEIATPNLDKLASEGVRFSDYHTASLCSPTRSMIMSGTDCHLAGVGVMSEFIGFNPDRWNKPGHEGYLNHDVAALPEVLQDAGYHTLLSGKWHLGFKDGHLPAHRGFDKSWALLPGCSNHFGWEPVYEDLEENKPWPNVSAIGRSQEGRADYEPNTNNSKDGFYSSQFYVDNLLKYFNERTPAEAEKPFFAYLPFSAPHWPLQALPEDRDKHKGLYDDGPDALRLRRLENLKKLGLIPENVDPAEMVAGKSKDWEELSPEEKRMSSRAMEVYAGMVHSMDREIGKVVDYLEESGDLDNTVVIFMSDNGAEGAALEAIPVMGTKLLESIDKWYDNSYENLGNHNSFIWYGPRWAQASTAPNRLWKSFATEGGIRVPMFIRYPGFRQYPAGSICHSFATCMDIMPTFLDLASAPHPNPNPSTPAEKAPYRGHQVYGMRGKSWVPYLRDGIKSQGTDGKGQGEEESEAIHSEGDLPVGWEMHGRASLRRGKWKIVNMPVSSYGTGGWQLYDLSKDRGELHDLATALPEKLEELKRDWARYQEETGTVFGPPLEFKVEKRGEVPADYIGGDPVEDQVAWMKVGHGARLGETSPKA
ncbi:hypothetical protein I350_03315 [Cryptococcus amylolentus CBS 6273]|uniref:Sulfatase N-terminal domain-containing protein n=1 Tax=Cryptococcus amylolentus CBS 6273 TaxID=1296118 RepID=A0A1E3K3P0_9TREE|nr:hypothetical protein I350_03315 [Cryptococcus amylolentus CBS 6273]